MDRTVFEIFLNDPALVPPGIPEKTRDEKALATKRAEQGINEGQGKAVFNMNALPAFDRAANDGLADSHFRTKVWNGQTQAVVYATFIKGAQDCANAGEIRAAVRGLVSVVFHKVWFYHNEEEASGDVVTVVKCLPKNK